jgi:dTDP-4-amino-4,6-dideoxygalactose transaminase
MDLPETELAAKQALSLPVHPSLSQSDLEKVVEVINAVASAGS